MSWRTVIITRRCKLESRLGYLVCRGEDTKRIYISEISTLIVESTAVSLTASLLIELLDAKINILFCDTKHNPYGQVLPLFGRHNDSGMLRAQIAWQSEIKQAVWAEIVRNKIHQQFVFLSELAPDRAKLLRQFEQDVVSGDVTNREGHAAKVYFNSVFGMDFRRGDDTFANSALDYGYSIILSAFNREIAAQGYITQLGLFHNNEFNHFNLSCDLMEPFRIIVDRVVFSHEFAELMPEYKRELASVLNRNVYIGGQLRTVSDAISVYCTSVFQAIERNDVSLLRFYLIP